MTNYLTVSEIADMWSMSRETINAATKNNKLAFSMQTRNGRKVKVVDFVDMVAVYGEPADRRVTPPRSPSDALSTLAIENAELKAKLEAFERIQQQTEKLVENMEGERDRALQNAENWRKQAETGTLLLTDERNKNEEIQEELQEVKAQASRSFFQKLFGKNN